MAALVRAGHLDQALSSTDICANSMLLWNGGHGYDYLLRTFVPLLREEGLTESEARTMLIENPRRVLRFSEGVREQGAAGPSQGAPAVGRRS